MTLPSSGGPGPASPGNRQPRIAIMGEFSSGKSTLTNLLLGADPLPTKVTATQLPPVWIAFGPESGCFEDQAGRRHPFELDRIAEIDLDETLVVRLTLEADILEMCDLIDMPGISDPNMPSDVWERLMDEVDCVIWCTPANQAWRQSEAAVWDSLPASLKEHSLLLVTHSDKLRTPEEREKVLARVRHETEGLFAGVYPVSVTQALAAEDDPDLWEQSGADAFVNHFVDILADPGRCVYDRVTQNGGGAASPEPAPAPPGTFARAPANPAAPRGAQPTSGFVSVKTKEGPRTPRPPKDEGAPTFQDVFFGSEVSAHRVARD